MMAYYETRLSHFFVLHFNIHDYFLITEDRIARLEDYLYEIFVNLLKYDLFLSYSQSTGFRTKERADSRSLQESFRNLAAEEASQEEKEDQSKKTKKILEKYTSQIESPVAPDKALPVIEKLLKDTTAASQKDDPSVSGDEPKKTVVLLNFLEKMVPADRSDPKVLEMLQRLALDTEICRTDNLLIGVTSDLGMVAPALFSLGSRCRPIRIPMPGENDKRIYLNYLKKKTEDDVSRLSNLGSDFGVESHETARIRTLCTLTRGFSLYDCDALNKIVK